MHAYICMLIFTLVNEPVFCSMITIIVYDFKFINIL